MSKLSRLGQQLYDGHVSINFVGRKWLWYSISAVILALATAVTSPTVRVPAPSYCSGSRSTRCETVAPFIHPSLIAPLSRI